jgi:hypothetical protein
VPQLATGNGSRGRGGDGDGDGDGDEGAVVLVERIDDTPSILRAL